MIEGDVLKVSFDALVKDMSGLSKKFDWTARIILFA